MKKKSGLYFERDLLIDDPFALKWPYVALCRICPCETLRFKTHAYTPCTETARIDSKLFRRKLVACARERDSSMPGQSSRALVAPSFLLSRASNASNGVVSAELG
ncbi:hypothetical protein MRX96_007096 [Rhipicephalus microplus]